MSRALHLLNTSVKQRRRKVTRWRGRKEPNEAAAPAKETETQLGSAPTIPQENDPRKFLFPSLSPDELREAREILDVLNQMVEAFDTLERAEALGRDPGEPMSVPEALETIYGEDEL